MERLKCYFHAIAITIIAKILNVVNEISLQNQIGKYISVEFTARSHLK